jgi:hypothetical protein
MRMRKMTLLFVPLMSERAVFHAPDNLAELDG